MKIAIATDNNQVSAHFGRCQNYTLFDVSDNQIISRENIDTPAHEPGLLPRFLKQMGVDTVIAGGMGPKAQGLFAEMEIHPVIGVSGPIDLVIQDYLTGSLARGESLCDHGKEGHNPNCDHH